MAGDIGTNFAGNVLSNVFCNVWNKGVEKGKMVIYLPQAVNQMKEDVGTLDNEIYDINAELNRKQWPAKRRVQTWLDKAAELKLTSETIVTEYDTYQQHKSCLGCCPNCVRRYRISNDIRDWTRKFSELYSEKAQPDFPRIGEYGDPTPRKQILIQDSDSGFVAGAKRSTHTELLESWLTDEDSKILGIGITGMGGVGKTSLLNIINDSQKVNTSFDYIIKVIVSRHNISHLQKQVADRLHLELPDYSEERKDVLRNVLKNKKVLLLLDDMWADDPWTSCMLQDLGVSLNDTGSKIVLTTRDEEVCARMNVEERIRVEPLVQEGGWQLFRSRAFENLNGNVPQELEEVAREIANECKGLPLAITVVAAAMKAHSTVLRQWENALDQMRNVPDTFDGLHSIVDKELFQRLKWSYDVLKPDSLKTCFLSFASYPEDRVISCEEVIDIWIAEGMIKGRGDSYLPDTADSFIIHLRNRCLIEVVQTDEVGRISRIKIHDILRDLAIRIAAEHGCYFKAGQGVKDFPLEEVDSDHCAKMSLMSNKIQSLPQTFKCSTLSVLLLSKNPDIKEVPKSFLNELPSLRVLDLSRTGITCLPPSIGNLKRLAFLQLQKTGICELPETIGDLKELQFLNLSQCQKLRCLPERIHELKRLRVLDTGNCSELRYLPRGISELVALERLTISVSSISLSFDEDADAGSKSACLKDLQSLRRLRVLTATMKSPVKEGVMGNWSKMRDLWLNFDDDVNQDELLQDMQAMKDLEIFSLRRCDVERLPSCLTQFRKLAYLCLNHCNQLKELPAELPCLRGLRILGCHKLEELELGMGSPKLDWVSLQHVRSLECVEATASGSGGLGDAASPLPMLKTLQVYRCENLKRLRGGWDKLKCLEVIKGDSREWWDAIECDDPSIKASLQSKFRE